MEQSGWTAPEHPVPFIFEGSQEEISTSKALPIVMPEKETYYTLEYMENSS